MRKSKENKVRVALFLRVSRDSQDYTRQERELTRFCEQRGYSIVLTVANKITGTKTLPKREDLKELLAAAQRKEFSKVIVSEISRIGRNAKDIRNTIDLLHSNKVSVVFYNLGGMESLDERGQETFISNVIISIYAEVAQEERRILSERIKSGLANARARGKKVGRPEGSKEPDEVLDEYCGLVKDIEKGFSLNQCMKLHSVSKNTVIKIKRLLKQSA